MLQDPFLFAGTIADNIRFAQPEATDDEVEATARASASTGSRRASPTASSHVGARGRRRACRPASGSSSRSPARCSPTRASSSSTRRRRTSTGPTELLIERALDRLLRGRTSIIIAHRLATVRRADEILVVERGRIVQRGTEQELLEEDGVFRRLARDLRAA